MVNAIRSISWLSLQPMTIDDPRVGLYYDDGQFNRMPFDRIVDYYASMRNVLLDVTVTTVPYI